MADETINIIRHIPHSIDGLLRNKVIFLPLTVENGEMIFTVLIPVVA